jgi:hypothetical protein
LSSELRDIKPGALVKIIRLGIDSSSHEIGLITERWIAPPMLWHTDRWWVLTADGKLDHYPEGFLEILEAT